MIDPTRSRFQNIRPVGAWLLLVLLLALCTCGVLVRASTTTLIDPAKPGERDVDLYERIINRVHAGEGYYQAAGSELRAGKYPLRPFMTWRLPTLAWFMAVLPSAPSSKIVVLGLGVSALLLWFRFFQKEGPRWMPIVGAILLIAPLRVAAIWPCPLQHETWCGVCIALSLGLYAQGYRRTSVVFGVLALFLRELALPFVVVMLVMAWWQQRKGEALAWAVGLAGFVAFLGFHAWMVNAQLTGGELKSQGWFFLGGWPFVIKTARANVLLLATPSWVAGLTLPLALLGLAGWSGVVGSRVALTVGIYVAAFLFAGRPIHAYWGLVYAPLLPLGWLFAPRALGDLIGAICRRPETATADTVTV